MQLRTGAAAALAVCLACSRTHQDATPTARTAKLVQVAHPIAGQYVVILADGDSDVSAAATALTLRHGGTVTRTYGAVLRGFAARLSPAQARAIAGDPAVRFVEEDGAVRPTAVQSLAPWALDRIDQRALPLDRTYAATGTGAGVHVYVVDSGVRATHSELAGRMGAGFGALDDGQGTDDCNGHGTAMASLAAGTVHGVAKGATVHPVRVFDCSGAGAVSAVLAGIDWITANRVAPAVASLSFSGAASPALDAAVERSIGAGVTYAVAAGNDGADACAASPARVPVALTVGAARLAMLPDGSEADLVWPFGNQGPCVDLFAPGAGVSAATAADDAATGTFDGTSVAAAHVAGAAALFLEQHPTAPPARVADALAGNTTLVALEGLAPHTTGRLLYTGFLAAGQGDTVAPTVAIAAPSASVPVVAETTLSADAQDAVGVTQVAWFVDGTLVGATAAAPYDLPWDSRTVGNGAHTIVARAYDAAGNAAEAQIAITVANPDGAAFDASLGVPACRTVGARCASGALLDGRAGLGPEAGAPSTLLLPCPDGGTSCARAPSCADATAGAYHVDESLDALEVRSIDGGPFAAGKVVEVTARAWSYSAFDGDALDLWFAPDATAPVWTYLGTLPATGGGARTYTYRYTLPAGALQAVRGVFRYRGDAAACSAGAYDDHDDLAFAVGAGTADTTKPFVRLDAPAAGDTVSSLTGLDATATDDTTVARVEFYADGALVGADSAAPYEIRWDADTLPDGDHVLRARAYDGSGNWSDSDEVKVKVKDLVPPTVEVVGPAEGALVARTVVVTADAMDNRGVATVSLYRGDALLATVATEPFEAAWDTHGVPDGTYVLSARAVDAQGNAATSAGVHVVVDNTPPSVHLTAPATGATIAGEIAVDAVASDANGIARIEVYAGDVLLGSCGSGNCSVPWNTSTGPNGDRTLFAKAFDGAGNAAKSAPISIHVQDDIAPTAAWSEVPAGYVRGKVTLAATASDPSAGAVVRVQFLARVGTASTLLADDDAEPYQLDWDTTTVPDGAYDLVALAFDGAGHFGGSAPAPVIVDNTPPTVDIVEPLEAADLTGWTKLTLAPVDAALDHVDVYADAVLVATLRPTAGGGWSTYWDTSGIDNGAHLLVAHAFDKAGNEGISFAVDVTVHNGSTADHDAALGAPRCSSVAPSCWSGTLLSGRGTVGPERDAPNTIGGTCADGNTGVLHVDESIDAVRVSTLDGTPLAAAKAVRLDATVWGHSADGSDEVDFYSAADATSATWVYLGTKAVTASGAQTLSWYFTLPTGGLQAVRVNYRFATEGPSPCSAGEYDDHDDLVFPTSQGPDTTAPSVAIVLPAEGGIVSGTMRVTATAVDEVGLEKVELYAGMTLLATRTGPPWEADWDTMGFADGVVALTAVASDTSGNVRTSAPVHVTVSNVLNAVYDDAFGAPRCSDVASFCSSGTLLTGRATLGPEPNEPNTYRTPDPKNRCLDGTSGTFHVDESVDALRVFTADGTRLTAGLPATVEATVWAYTGYDADRLDLYAAADASAPAWTYLGTLQPAASGRQVLSAQLVLPTGGAQVVRARYRYGGSPGPCGTGSYDDHDDLAFAVDQNVGYDAGLHAPACPSAAAFCDSGALLVGRGSLGPEPNAPNTLKNASCADGNAGAFHVDPSIDGIRVTAADGARLAAGRTVQVDLHVWASSAWATEAVDVYEAPSADAPVWTYVGTVQPQAAGAQMLTVRTVLPVGARQAIRAHYRTGGSPAVCGSGATDDQDDLVFAVDP